MMLLNRRLGFFGGGRRLHGLELVADRLERSKFVLVLAETIDVGTVASVDGLFRAHREILVKTGLLRTLHRLNIGGNVPGLIDGQYGLIVGRAVRHVAVNEIRSRDQAAHARAVVETVRPPEWRKLVSSGVADDTRSFALTVIAMAGGAGLREDLGSGDRIGWSRQFRDLARTAPISFRADRPAGGEEFDIGDESLHLIGPDGQRTAVDAAGHAAVDPLFQRANFAFARAILRKNRRRRRRKGGRISWCRQFWHDKLLPASRFAGSA